MNYFPTYVFALQQEAKPFIETLNVKQIYQQKNIKLYKSDEVFVLITGIGCMASATAVGWFLAQYKNVILWNIGCAASTANVGSWQRVICVKQDNNIFYPEIVSKSKLKLNTLNTVNTVINNSQLKHFNDELVDMEGIGFATAALTFINSNQIQLLKWISDNGNINFYKDKAWINAYVQRINEVIELINQESNLISKYLNDININTNAYIEKVNLNLQLSFTQKEQLHKALVYYLNLNHQDKLIHLLNDFLTQLNNKLNNKSNFKDLLNKLYCV
ncbi:MAG: hypothetical protein LCH32_09105 [Bacteroidetes bacterium]|nr:hypothetical protein [Bacteroidota bacterium]